DCDEYHGVDLSSAALASLQNQLEAKPISSVRLTQAAAHEFSAIPVESYDVVVINSVVQYFPDAAYLLRVIESAARAVRPSGYIFVGDVRSYPLLESFRASIELATAEGSTRLNELSERIRERSAAEQELYLHPAFFETLQAQVPAITAVEVQLKRGRYD